MSVIWWVRVRINWPGLGFPGQLPLADKLIYVRDKCGKCGFLFFPPIANHEVQHCGASICSTYFKIPNYRQPRQIEGTPISDALNGFLSAFNYNCRVFTLYRIGQLHSELN